MSGTNVELVRRAFEAWYPNDSEEFARYLDPEFEYVVSYGPERGVYKGWKATVEAFDRWQLEFADYRWGATEFIDAAEDCVVVPFVEGGLGRASGAAIEQRPAFVCEIRSAKILRITEYRTTADALEAAKAGNG